MSSERENEDAEEDLIFATDASKAFPIPKETTEDLGNGVAANRRSSMEQMSVEEDNFRDGSSCAAGFRWIICQKPDFRGQPDVTDSSSQLLIDHVDSRFSPRRKRQILVATAVVGFVMATIFVIGAVIATDMHVREELSAIKDSPTPKSETAHKKRQRNDGKKTDKHKTKTTTRKTTTTSTTTTTMMTIPAQSTSPFHTKLMKGVGEVEISDGENLKADEGERKYLMEDEKEDDDDLNMNFEDDDNEDEEDDEEEDDDDDLDLDLENFDKREDDDIEDDSDDFYHAKNYLYKLKKANLTNNNDKKN